MMEPGHDSHSSGGDDFDASVALRDMIMGFRKTQMIYTAARLGIADLLEDGPRSAPDLAGDTRTDPRSLYRLLRALSGLGVFAETPDGRFELAPPAELLRSGSPGSMRGMALLFGDGWMWQAYGEMFYSVSTGLTAFERVHGQSFYEYQELHPAAAAVFDGAMTSFSGLESTAVLKEYDFSGLGNIVDVGGGRGALLAAILNAASGARGIVFDRPELADGAAELMRRAGLANRCDFVGGDFFEGIPDGGDAYIMKSVLHNWDDDSCHSILGNCREAMGPDSRLLVVERVVPDGAGPSEAKLFDVNMLVTTGGLERTEREYAELFERTGFELARIIPTNSPVSVVEGLPREPA